MIRRVQLTLFVPDPARERIEAVRKCIDPVQFGLLPAHVTLCREDELEGLNPLVLAERLQSAEARPITLGFGQPEAFSTHGVLLPCTSGEEGFLALRQLVLGSGAVRHQPPHITLAHPRNPRGPVDSLLTAATLGNNLQVRFVDVCYIQQDGVSPWQVLHRFPLRVAGGGEG